jgi:hypothetical protein
MRKLTLGLFIISISLALVLQSCKKEVQKEDCEVNNYGTVTISNSSSNPYGIYIDGVYKMNLNGGAVSTPINIYEGNNRKLYAVQLSGFLLYPTEKTTYFNVVSCSDYSWQIP